MNLILQNWQWFLTAWPWLVGVAALAGIWYGYGRREATFDWIEERAHNYAERRMTWRNEARFKRRINRRIRWLRFRQWMRRPPSGNRGRHLRRPLAVVMIVAASIGLLIYLGIPLDHLPERLKALADGKGEKLQWQTALILAGAPIAFVLWWFRDIHVNEQLENQRKDVNLKEFQEIQMRAAGALDADLPASARETLQIAAIHQLRPFLKGEYGDSFRRPAWEFLRARLRASAEATGERAIARWVEAGGFPRRKRESGVNRARRTVEEIKSKIAVCEPGPVTKAARAVVREEVPMVFHRALSLTETQFDGIDFPTGAMLARLQLTQSSFVRANMRGAHLEGANLIEAHLEGADLIGAHLEGAKLSGAHMEGADLIGVHLEGADLRGAHLEGAVLFEANLEGADLSGAHLEGATLIEAHLEGTTLIETHLEGAYLYWARFDNATVLLAAVYDEAGNAIPVDPAAMAAAQQNLRDLGVQHVDDSMEAEPI